jgi:hypothetical protein
MRRKMPRAVTSANGSGNGEKRGDQRAETGERRGARFNRIVDLHCVVVYSLRVGTRALFRTPSTVALSATVLTWPCGSGSPGRGSVNCWT